MAGGTRFYVDESLMGVGKAYEYLRHDTVHPGHRGIPELVPGALDDDWIPVVAGRVSSRSCETSEPGPGPVSMRP